VEKTGVSEKSSLPRPGELWLWQSRWLSDGGSYSMLLVVTSVSTHDVNGNAWMNGDNPRMMRVSYSAEGMQEQYGWRKLA
jgi:hypothetical protein